MTAVAKVGAKVSFVTRDEFSHLMLSEPHFALMIVRILAAEVRTARVAISECPTAPPQHQRDS
jgi:hypothetical protein